MSCVLHIATIVSDAGRYEAMRDSMAVVGFDDRRCRFTRFDNTLGNRHDPYRVLHDLRADGTEPHFILCHQDLLFGERCTFDRLMGEIARLDRTDAQWAVAGTAGISARGERLLHLDDPTGQYRVEHLPRKVVTLDENFLLVRRSHAPVSSVGLSGFHFYGADLCLNAAWQHHSAYVIDFPLKHLSGGTASEAFHAGRNALANWWRPKLLVGIINTPSAEVRASCYRAVERLLARGMVVRLLRRVGCSVVFRPALRRA